MSENFHLLGESGKKCWEVLKNGLHEGLGPDSGKPVAGTWLNASGYIDSVKHELHENPKKVIAIAAEVALVAIIGNKLMKIFPAEEELLAGIKEAKTASNITERVVSIDSIDRAAVLKGIQKDVTPRQIEGINNMVSITATRTPKSGGMAELLADIKRQTGGSSALTETGVNQELFEQLAPRLPGADLTPGLSPSKITSYTSPTGSLLTSPLMRRNLSRSSNLQLVTEPVHKTTY